ncbi:unnamed protein product [Cladocopium goreaui]|uniref:Major facilitator superfamily (MFS) profile domain-containing protein n=2 Tax=Cladocopium goreaui TaxID=2562237 RepID=A0A9P1CPV2_9DINO|nr:unnamed protein product [Cladocopium goreaui]
MALHHKDIGAIQRAVIIGSAIYCCLVTAGTAFGFSALMPSLLKVGAFAKVCQPGIRSCNEQIARLTGMFTLASSLLNIFTLPSGAMLDALGPRATAAVFGGLATFGCWIYSLGPENDTNYTVGFILMSLSGPYIFNCTMSFGNFFPAHAGLITACLVGSFDASSGDFAILASMIDTGLSFGTAFRLLALMTATCWLTTFAWPDSPVESAKESERRELVKRDVWEICRSAEFWLLVYTASISMISLNFFIATAYPQLLSGGLSGEDADTLNSDFAWLLPAGGIVFAPLIGTIVDRLGVAMGYIILQCTYGAFTFLLMVYSTIGTSYSFPRAAFVCFAFCRPLFYTLNPVFCGRHFGQSNFGSSFGLTLTIAGFCNLLVQPLASLANTRGFPLINSILGLLQFSTILFPIWLMKRTETKHGDTLPYSSA